MNSLSLRDGFGLFLGVLPCAHAADHEENEGEKREKERYFEIGYCHSRDRRRSRVG